MSTIEIDEDLLNFLNSMRKGDETINDVLRKVIMSIEANDKESLEYVSKEEFESKADEILKKYDKLLLRLAE